MQGRRWLVTFAARGQCRAASRERVGHGSHGRAGRAGLPPATSRQRGRASTLSLNPERGGGPAEAAAGGGFSGCGPLYCDLRAPRDSGLGRSCARASLRVSKSSTCLMCARPHTTTQAAFSPHAIMDAAPPHTERQELAARETAGGGARHTHTLRPKSQVLLPAKGLRWTQTPERGGSQCLTSRPSPPDRLGPPRACRARR